MLPFSHTVSLSDLRPGDNRIHVSEYTPMQKHLLDARVDYGITVIKEQSGQMNHTTTKHTRTGRVLDISDPKHI